MTTKYSRFLVHLYILFFGFSIHIEGFPSVKINGSSGLAHCIYDPGMKLTETKYTENQIYFFDYLCDQLSFTNYSCVGYEYIKKHNPRVHPNITPDLNQTCYTWIGLIQYSNIFYSPKYYLFNYTHIYGIPTLHNDLVNYNTPEKYGSVNISGETYDSLIVSFIPWPHVYGHVIKEITSMYYFFPEDIIRRSHYVINNDSFRVKYLREILTSAGINMSKVAFLDPNNFYYTRNIYISYSFYPNGYSFGFILKLKKNILSHYNLKYENPSSYILHRRKNYARSINNFDFVYKNIQSTFPNITWEIMPNTLDTFIETLKIFIRAKFYFSATGSSMMNILFMKKGMGCAYYFFNSIDPPVIITSIVSNIWSACFEIPNLDHRISNCHFSMSDIKNLVNTFKKVFYAIEFKRWPQTSECHVLKYNKSELFNYYRYEYIDKYFLPENIHMLNIADYL